VRRLLPLLVLLLLPACSADEEPAAAPSARPSASPSVGQRIDEVVEGRLDGVALRLEVADDPDERAVGLMGRTAVPPGTGMVFLFEELTKSPFYMFRVPVPLVAVFVRDGVVVGVEQMVPCTETEPQACPFYGPGEPFDTVVETAPETLPGVAVGDRLELAAR
jgi:uncharacterized protein